MIENQKHNWRRQITRETAPHSWRKSPSKSKDYETNNKNLTIHVTRFTLLLMLINTNIVHYLKSLATDTKSSFSHKISLQNLCKISLQYLYKISLQYLCPSQDCPPCGQSWGGQAWGSPTNMLLHQSHIMFYVSTNPKKIHASTPQYKFMYHSHIIFFILLPIPKKYVSTFQYSCHKICFSIHPTNMYWSHKYASTYQSHKYACVSILHKYVPFTHSH